MLTDEILAIIMERPGISAPEIRAAFPTINRNSLAGAIGRLLRGCDDRDRVSRPLPRRQN